MKHRRIPKDLLLVPTATNPYTKSVHPSPTTWYHFLSLKLVDRKFRSLQSRWRRVELISCFNSSLPLCPTSQRVVFLRPTFSFVLQPISFQVTWLLISIFLVEVRALPNPCSYLRLSTWSVSLRMFTATSAAWQATTESTLLAKSCQDSI